MNYESAAEPPVGGLEIMMETRSIPKQALRRLLSTPILIVLSSAILIAAYIPNGPFAIYNGFTWPITNLSDFPSFRIALWYSWLLIGTIIGNIQIISCLIFASKRHSLLQNPMIKIFAIISQFLWGFEFGAIYYFWYLWVFGSAVLYAATPNIDFSWKSFFLCLIPKNDDALNRTK